MAEAFLSLVVIGALSFGPLAWRLRRDRAEAAALAVRADIKTAVRRALGGESLVAVHVTPKSAWRAGRVLLSAPAWLLDDVWRPVLRLVPAGYELVLKPDDAPPAPTLPRRQTMKRAA